MDKKYTWVAIVLMTLIVTGTLYTMSNKSQKQAQVFPTPQANVDQVFSEPTPSDNMDTMEEATELKVEDIVVGTGDEAVAGKKVTVNYSGTLTDGTKFDSSYDRNQPFSFTLGAGEVIQGWDQGVVGMKVGGKRKLVIPSDLGYGASGAGGVIPPNATLVFEVELLSVE